MLELKGLSSGYGAIEALKSIDMRIDKGEIVTLIGANGAGKSTTLRSITGLVVPSSGEVIFEGRKLNGTPTHQITRLGISMVPEGRAIFANLTVLENLEMGAYLQKDKAQNAASLERVFTLVSSFEGTSKTGRRHAERRRAADAGDRKGADGPSTTVAA